MMASCCKRDLYVREKSTVRTLVPVLAVLLLLELASPVPADSPPVLLAGSSNPGRVYLYDEGRWIPISPVLGYSVLSMVEYRGELYVGVTTGFGIRSGVGQVWKFDGRGWSLVGDGLDHNVNALIVYKGDLYAGTSLNGMRVYRYRGGKSWELVVDEQWYPWGWMYGGGYGTRSLAIFKGNLVIGDTFWDLIALWDGKQLYRVQPYETGSCIYDFEEYRGQLYAAAYQGRIWVSGDGRNWEIVGDYYDGNLWEMEVYRGELYMGYQCGELRRWRGEGNIRGELVYQAPAPIISMETDGKFLYFGTGGDAPGFGETPEGVANIYRYDGREVKLVSDWDQFGSGVQVLHRVDGWKDLARLRCQGW